MRGHLPIFDWFLKKVKFSLVKGGVKINGGSIFVQNCNLLVLVYLWQHYKAICVITNKVNSKEIFPIFRWKIDFVCMKFFQKLRPHSSYPNEAEQDNNYGRKIMSHQSLAGNFSFFLSYEVVLYWIKYFFITQDFIFHLRSFFGSLRWSNHILWRPFEKFSILKITTSTPHKKSRLFRFNWIHFCLRIWSSLSCFIRWWLQLIYWNFKKSGELCWNWRTGVPLLAYNCWS